MLAFFSIALTQSTSQAHESQHEQHIEVALRMIGHQVLLNAGDSTSRVLPVEKEGSHYSIQFDTEFQFVAEELVETVNRIIQNAGIDGNYIVSMEECSTSKVIYSYEMRDLFSRNIIPCKSRAQPRTCYKLLFTLLQTETQHVSSDSLPSNVAIHEVVKKGFLNASQSKPLVISVLALLLAGLLVIVWKKRPQSNNNPHLISIGDYQFDKRNTELIYNQERVKLTGKEADLLILLIDAANTTIGREAILNSVWGDEGSYVGRTLDVFISKLRKKLEADPRVKIENVRGVGYKLVVG